MMYEIVDSLKKIVDIISVIDGIVFQINIFVLNVVVEVVCVGEQGCGFVVVVGEVCNFVSCSVQAVKEIKVFIEDFVLCVDIGLVLVESVGEIMNNIVNVVICVIDIMGEIVLVLDEQSCGID